MKNYNYHYVYRITNTVTGYHYYGSKSCDEQPKENIGIKYFSSSSNKLFIQDQKNNPQDYKYKVVKEFKHEVISCIGNGEVFSENFIQSLRSSFFRISKWSTPRRSSICPCSKNAPCIAKIAIVILFSSFCH